MTTMESNQGGSDLFYGPVSGTLSATTADAIIEGAAFDEIGRAVAPLGDVTAMVLTISLSAVTSREAAREERSSFSTDRSQVHELSGAPTLPSLAASPMSRSEHRSLPLATSTATA